MLRWSGIWWMGSLSPAELALARTGQHLHSEFKLIACLIMYDYKECCLIKVFVIDNVSFGLSIMEQAQQR